MTLAQETTGVMKRLPKRNQPELLWNSRPAFRKQQERNADAEIRAAVWELAGLWKDHENELSVDETVRDMRKGRFLGN